MFTLISVQIPGVYCVPLTLWGSGLKANLSPSTLLVIYINFVANARDGAFSRAAVFQVFVHVGSSSPFQKVLYLLLDIPLMNLH